LVLHVLAHADMVHIPDYGVWRLVAAWGCSRKLFLN